MPVLLLSSHLSAIVARIEARLRILLQGLNSSPIRTSSLIRDQAIATATK